MSQVDKVNPKLKFTAYSKMQRIWRVATICAKVHACVSIWLPMTNIVLELRLLLNILIKTFKNLLNLIPKTVSWLPFNAVRCFNLVNQSCQNPHLISTSHL